VIRLNVFDNAFTKVPSEQTDCEWHELCDALEDMTQTTAKPGDPIERKKTLPAVTFGTLTDNERAKDRDGNRTVGSPEAPANLNANYVDHTALAIDVDECSQETLDALDALGLALLVYASPSDPNPDGSRRVRIIAALSEPIAPGDVKHARRALAEMIGIGPGQGVERADAISQVMFVGRLHGTPARELWRIDGEPLDAAELVATPLRAQWVKPKVTNATDPLPRVALVDPDERTAALLEAIAEHWEAPGEATGRRQVLRALGGYLAKRGWPDSQIAAVARGLETERPEAVRVELMIECARQARLEPDASAGWSTLLEWNADAAAVIESIAKDPREPEGFPGVWAPVFAKMFDRVGQAAPPKPPASVPDPFAPADSGVVVPLFLCSRNGCVTLMWEGDDYGHRPIHEKRIRLRARELGYDQSMIDLYGKSGKPLTVEAILEAHSKSYEHTAYAFGNTVTQYDPSGTGRVLIGYPKPSISAVFDQQVDAWLRALGGSSYERLRVWVASCSQANIDRLSACLILIGRRNIGKSMLGLALARMWGEEPPPLSLISVTFNADMQRCPILVDEEAQLFGSKELSTKRFRDVIQARHRSIELKGKERCQLHGGLRAVVSCNGYSDLRFSDLGGPAVVEALRDRMCVIDALERTDEVAAALEPLKDPIGLVDLERIARHLVWLGENTELPAERFLGAGGDATEGAVLAGHIDEHVDVWESFRDWVEGSSSAGPWYVASGGLCVDTSALSISLENTGRGWDHRKVREALAPFHTGDTRVRTDGARPRVWCVDADRIAEAMRLDAETRSALNRRLAGNLAQPRGTGGRFGRFEG
jgi:hypothetical protein